MSETPSCLTPSTEERKCCKCDDPAVIKKPGSHNYCIRHWRFRHMRGSAASDGKVVPSDEWLDANIPAGMVCPCCQQTMKWTSNGGGRAEVISLQHDRDGGMRLICQRCNVRHAKMPGDSFYDLPEGHKWCPECAEIKPLDEFYKVKAGYCKSCVKIMNTSYTEANREAISTRMKAHRAANREAINARMKERRDANRDAFRARARERYAARRDALKKLSQPSNNG